MSDEDCIHLHLAFCYHYEDISDEVFQYFALVIYFSYFFSVILSIPKTSKVDNISIKFASTPVILFLFILASANLTTAFNITDPLLSLKSSLMYLFRVWSVSFVIRSRFYASCRGACLYFFYHFVHAWYIIASHCFYYCTFSVEVFTCSHFFLMILFNFLHTGINCVFFFLFREFYLSSTSFFFLVFSFIGMIYFDDVSSASFKLFILNTLAFLSSYI